ncbi:MAG: caspase family protein [Alphaproteobacteria bacterium]|nr:caspase family protein [Alphaproteobacteria bacterium]
MSLQHLFRCLMVAFLCAPVIAWAGPAKRFALLIGNQDYTPAVGQLTNPLNDIDILGTALGKIGFEVKILKNATRVDINREIGRLALNLESAGDEAIGFFYYSGHGVARSKDHINYLIPVDITDMSSDDFWYNAVSLDSILKELQSVAPLASNFIVFDACRNELHLPSKTTSKGFEPVGQTNGIFIAFSTSPNDTASDVGEKGGPYARSLSAELLKAGQDHLTLFQNVKERVFWLTKNTQRPWESNGFIQRIYLAGAPKYVPSPANQAEQTWNIIKAATDSKIFENFERLYSGTEYADLAKARRQELAKALGDGLQSGGYNAASSKVILSLLPDSPVYSAGDLMKIKIVAASNMVKAFAVFPFGPRARSKVEASYNSSEGGLYIPYRIPGSAKQGMYSIPVYVQEINSKLEEKLPVEIEIK